MAKTAPDISELIDIMARLRDPVHGCPWDVGQSFESIAPYTIEEAYEVADAIARNDMPALADELGDLLFQVTFHARMAEEAGEFAFNDVISAICQKMVRRHPHVFAGANVAPDWEALKAGERSETTETGALSGVALALPALMRAEKIQKRAAHTGFDWPDASGALAKIYEEIGEIESATSPEHQAEEIGDLLFAVVNWSRHLKIDAEHALRSATAKFEKRFEAMEASAGADFAALSLVEKEELWVQAKRRA